MLPWVEGVGFFGLDLLGLADELVDCGDRLLVRIGLAEVGDNAGDRRLLHRADIDIIGIFVEQIDVGGAQITLKPVEQEGVRQIDRGRRPA